MYPAQSLASAVEVADVDGFPVTQRLVDRRQQVRRIHGVDESNCLGWHTCAQKELRRRVHGAFVVARVVRATVQEDASARERCECIDRSSCLRFSRTLHEQRHTTSGCCLQ